MGRPRPRAQLEHVLERLLMRVGGQGLWSSMKMSLARENTMNTRERLYFAVAAASVAAYALLIALFEAVAR